MKRLFFAIPSIALTAAAALFLARAMAPARTLLVAGIGMALLFAIPFLPVYTPARSRVFRWLKWVMLIGMLVLAFGPDALRQWWLIGCSLWPMVWIEGRRVAIRRKLPVAQWPKQLYL